MLGTWLLIVPPGFLYLFIFHAPQHIDWLQLLLFTFLSILIVSFSAYENGRPIFLVIWITLPAFLLWGVLIEALVMHLSIIVSLFIYKSEKPIYVRYLFSSFLYFILSIGSAIAFHFAGGFIGILDFSSLLIAVFAYQITYILIKHFIFKIYELKFGDHVPYMSKTTKWDYVIAFLILPYSLTLYYLVHYVGNGAFFLLGIPYFLVIFILRLYNNSEKINEELQKVEELGHSLSNNLTEEKVLDQFTRKSAELFNAEYAYLFDHKDDCLELIRSYEQDQFVDITMDKLLRGEGIVGSVLQNNEPVIYGEQTEWIHIARNYLHHSHQALQSVLCVPIIRNQKTEGVLFLSSERKNAFQDFQLRTLNILSSYFAISVEKARYVEEAIVRSERCALTKLYNYIYLDERLEEEVKKVKIGQRDTLSVLMLDIDHFKKVNDTYGHQSGNDILKSFADVLVEMLPKEGIVARYGGEEFVYLLPGMAQNKAVEFAEEVRRRIEVTKFRVVTDLGDVRKPIDVQITISIGVSTTEKGTEASKVILRNADRSLYLGAKQKGRNRVASYQM